MKIILDGNRFKDYTIIHKKDIGIDLAACFSGIVTGLTIVVPVIVNFREGGIYSIANWLLFIVGAAALTYGTFKALRFAKNHYTSEKLYKDVENMNEAKHCFSLVAIKDTFNKHPNRFLLKYDSDWDCDLFFSFHTLEDETKNIDNIKARLANLLKVDPEEITVQFVNETLQTKFSWRDKINKVYSHRLYSAQIKAFPQNEKDQTFIADGTRYKWATIEDMKQDLNIRKKNLDVVDFVSANIP